MAYDGPVTTTTEPPAASRPTGTVPLVALLGQAEAVYEREFDRRVAEAGFPALSLAHARNVLRHLAEGPARASQLVDRCGVSKQAVSQQVAHLERAGYLSVSPDPTDQRARVVALTEQGRRAQCVVVRLFAEIETDWAATHGDLADVRRVLTAVIHGAGERPSCDAARRG